MLHVVELCAVDLLELFIGLAIQLYEFTKKLDGLIKEIQSNLGRIFVSSCFVIGEIVDHPDQTQLNVPASDDAGVLPIFYFVHLEDLIP